MTAQDDERIRRANRPLSHCWQTLRSFLADPWPAGEGPLDAEIEAETMDEMDIRDMCQPIPEEDQEQARRWFWALTARAEGLTTPK